MFALFFFFCVCLWWGRQVIEVSFLLQRAFPEGGDSFTFYVIIMNTVLLAFIIV